MRKNRRSVLFLVVTCTLLLLIAWGGSSAQAETATTASAKSSVVPHVVKFSGTAKNLNGIPLTDIVGITFSLYQEESGGAALWMETQNVHADAAGHYTVSLGTDKPLPVELFSSGEARWLGVQMASQAEQPRVLLLSVPYALKAADAETLGGKPASAFLQAANQNDAGTEAAAAKLPPGVHGNGTVNYLPLWTAKNIIDKSSLFQSGSNVGIGTTSPAAALDVNGGADVRNTLTLFPNGGAPALSVSGTPFSISSTGLVNFSAAQVFPSVAGLNTANTFTQPQLVKSTTGGLAAFASDPDGVGLFGYNPVSGAGSGIGVEGASTADNGIGVEGWATGQGGFGFFSANNVKQDRSSGGWVKAMVEVDVLLKTITKCYNSQASGAAISTPPCGFTLLGPGIGGYTLDFGFQVSDRFYSTSSFDIVQSCSAYTCNSVTPNQILVILTNGKVPDGEPSQIIVF